MTILVFTASALAHGVGDLLAEAMKRHVADRVKRGQFSDAKINTMMDRRRRSDASEETALTSPRRPDNTLTAVGIGLRDTLVLDPLRAFRRWVEARDCESSKSEGTSRTDPGKGRRSRSHRDRQRGAPG